MYGRGTVPAPASAGVLTRTVSQQVKLGSGRALLADNSAWGYIFADNRNGPCATLASSVHINVPMYVTGNLCLDSSAQVQQSASPVTVEGSLQTNSAASLGTSAAHLSQLHVGVGCRYGTVGSFTFPCTTGEHVWVDSQDQAVGTATKPPVDLPYWYQNAMPGPAAYCTSGTFPAAFDNDGT
ncbi:MAG TPA: hypothetical protein VKJ07_17150, partial [Mycobacteriales bacterium]|nr:hypothetical protein [Mycobacteriales bacterium]